MTLEEAKAQNADVAKLAGLGAARDEALRVRACKVMARIVGKSGRDVAISYAERRDVYDFLTLLMNRRFGARLDALASANTGMIHGGA